MPKPPLVLDTCAVSERSFIEWLGQYRERKIIPAMAYKEQCTHLLNRNKDINSFNYLLKRLNIEIESFDQRYAIYMAQIEQKFKPADNNSNDFIIGAHAYMPPRILVTYNVKHFPFLEGRVIEPDILQKEYRR